MEESESKKIIKETIDDGVRIIEYSDGSTIFKPLDMTPKNQPDNRSWWEKIKDWFCDHDVKPYIRIRDLADPTGERRNDPDDIDVGSDGKSAAEIGIKISF